MSAKRSTKICSRNLTLNFKKIPVGNERGLRNVEAKHPTTYIKTLMHLFKGNMGLGVFAIGDAYKHSGNAVAPWLIILFAVICVHGKSRLLRSAEQTQSDPFSITGYVADGMVNCGEELHSCNSCRGIIFTFPIQFYIPIEIMFPSVRERFGPFKYPVFAELAFRTFIVLLTFILAEAIPYYDFVISLLGASSSTAIVLFIPPILEFVTRWNKLQMKPWVVVKNLGIICGTGCYESIRLIIKAIAKERN